MLHQFPLVSLRDARKASFASHVVNGFREQGFLAVHHHGATRALLDEAEQLTKDIFTTIPLEILEKEYGRPDIFRQRGVSIFQERAASLDGKSRPPVDMKMFWMIRDEEQPIDPSDNPHGKNIWPDAYLPQFRTVMQEILLAYKEVYMTLLSALEEGVGLPSGKLCAMAKGADTILRPLFYPSYDRLREMGMRIPQGSQRSAPHEDINVLTVLRPRPGLWAKLQGTWVKADATDPDMLWVNIGEMLAQVDGVTGFVPTLHCVGTPPGEHDPEGDALLAHDRVSLPLFSHFRRSVFLREGLRVGDWLDDRLRTITHM